MLSFCSVRDAKVFYLLCKCSFLVFQFFCGVLNISLCLREDIILLRQNYTVHTNVCNQLEDWTPDCVAHSFFKAEFLLIFCFNSPDLCFFFGFNSSFELQWHFFCYNLACFQSHVVNLKSYQSLSCTLCPHGMSPVINLVTKTK